VLLDKSFTDSTLLLSYFLDGFLSLPILVRFSDLTSSSAYIEPS